MKTRRGKLGRVLRSLLVIGLAGVTLIVAFIGWANLAAVLAGRGKLHDKVSSVPSGGVALVFGCDDKIDGRENLYFKYRVEAAAELWDSGKIRCIIVSGDNRTKHYNEPMAMRAALIELGVPANRVVQDFAGLRTLDSVVRAQKVFGVEEVVFVSQKFQNERAAYIAKANGLGYSGFNARDVNVRGGLKTRLREIGARVKMWLDVRVLDTAPRYLGEREELPA